MFFGGGDEIQALRQKVETLQEEIADLKRYLADRDRELFNELTKYLADRDRELFNELTKHLADRDRQLFDVLKEISGRDIPSALKEFDERVNENEKRLDRAIKMADNNQLQINEIRNTQINFLGNNTLTDEDNRVWSQKALDDIALSELARELQQLRSAMRDESSEPDHDISIGEVAVAEKAAQEGKSSAVLEHLRKAGTWALDVANKIGVGVAIAALKAALGV